MLLPIQNHQEGLTLSTQGYVLDAQDQRIELENGDVAFFRGTLQNQSQLGGLLTPPHGASDAHLAYAAFHADCIDLLTGRLACVILTAGKVHVFRDHFGVEPVYYGTVKDGCTLYISTDLTPLYDNADLDNTLDKLSLADRQLFLYPLADRTMVKGIKKVEPSHTVTFVSNGSQISIAKKRYYQYQLAPDESITLDQATQGLNELLCSKLGHFAEQHKNLSVSLSGGVDSCLLAAILAKTTDKPIHAFTAFDQMNDDELDVAQQLAAKLGLEHHVHAGDVDQCWEDFLPLLKQCGSPVLLTLLSYFHLCAQIGPYADGCVSGLGADQVFWGNPEYLSRENYLNKLKDKTEALQSNNIELSNEAVQALEQLFGTSTTQQYQQVLHLFNINNKIPNELDSVYSKLENVGGFKFFSPFLDKDVVEFAAKLPFHLKSNIQLHIAKYVIKFLAVSQYGELTGSSALRTNISGIPASNASFAGAFKKRCGEILPDTYRQDHPLSGYVQYVSQLAQLDIFDHFVLNNPGTNEAVKLFNRQA
ncbi:MAG: asparagine synthase-related protein [Psychrosphaera sp.]|nr:asparagine synthase-related protein [Psychrosphaera sp.]